jgi:FkbM family methyltransferase
METTFKSSEIEAQANGELRFWLSITRSLPGFRGTGRIVRAASRIYNRRKRPYARIGVLDFEMVLSPTDSQERDMLFRPQYCDREEMDCLREHLKPGDTFLDAGANVGFYSMVASRLVGETGKVLAVEADPFNASRVVTNVEVNKMKNVRVINFGLSDKAETLQLGLNTTGNRGGNSFLSTSSDSVSVQCKTLTDVLLSEKVEKVDGAKMDIEGFEFKVLNQFFQDGMKNLFPRFLIIEINPAFEKRAGGDVQTLLEKNGYRLSQMNELNYLAVRN